MRYEDVLARKARKIHALGLTGDTGVDIQETAAAEGNGEKRRAILAAGKAGKSAAQAKRSAGKPPEGGSETELLLGEKERIEKTIEYLNRRLREIIRRLNTDSGGFHGNGERNGQGTAA